MTAQDQQSRAEFEAWWRKYGLGGEEVQWEAWQAARALPAGVEPVAYLYHDARSLAELMANEQACPGVLNSVLLSLKRHGGYRNETPLYTAAQVLAMGRVPPGWQVVPVEPTRAMMDALHSSHSMRLCYRAALATAPRPPIAP